MNHIGEPGLILITIQTQLLITVQLLIMYQKAAAAELIFMNPAQPFQIVS